MVTSFHPLSVNVKLLKSPFSVQNESETYVDAIADKSFEQFYLCYTTLSPIFPKLIIILTKIKIIK